MPSNIFWMPDILKFMFSNAEVCNIPLKCVKLCSGWHVVELLVDQFSPFEVFFFKALLGKRHHSIYSGASLAINEKPSKNSNQC